LSYYAACACGAAARVHGADDLAICLACDEANGVVVLQIALAVRAADPGLADILVVASGRTSSLTLQLRRKPKAKAPKGAAEDDGWAEDLVGEKFI
jgi:hypothetical protein